MNRAIVFFAFLLTCFLFLCIAAPLLALHFFVCLLISARSEYGLNVFIAWDQLLNVLAAPFLNVIFKNPTYKFGYPDETISSVIGKNLRFYGKCADKSLVIVDRVLSKIDPTSKAHSIDAIEDDEGGKV